MCIYKGLIWHKLFIPIYASCSGRRGVGQWNVNTLSRVKSRPHHQQCRSNVRLSRSNRSTRSIRQRCESHVTPIISLLLVKLSSSKFMYWLIQRRTSACMIHYSEKWCVQSHLSSLNFRKWVIISRKRCETSLQWKTNKNSYMVYIEWHHCECAWRSLLLFETFITLIARET